MQHARRNAVPVGRHAHPDRGGATVDRDDGGVARRVVPQQRRRMVVQKPGGLDRDRSEHLLGLDATRDELRDPPQRRLLLRQPVAVHVQDLVGI